jgi:hypothetical protein
VASFLRPRILNGRKTVKEETMSDVQKQHYEGDEDIIRRNIEGSQDLIEARRRAAEDDDIEPPADDPQLEYDKKIPPGQINVPFGGTSNPHGEGGTANRRKRG